MSQQPNSVTSVPGDVPPRVPKRHNGLRAVVSAVVILALSAVGILYGQRVIDHVEASNFHPTTQIAAITTRIGLTDRGHDVFYATSPLVEAKAEFNNNCKSEERTAAILGCYYRDRIYLYNIDNAKLDGTLEVTAAHEMLHAAYQRLNWFERQKVDILITAQYTKVKDDAGLKEIMQYYSKAEPGAEVNELHSILGTTIAVLDPELERYYGQYFTDRAQVVKLNAAYNKVFGELKQKANVLEANIKAHGPSITADLASYETDRQQLESDIASFNQEAASGSFRTQGSFNTARAALINRADALNARRDEINARVETYNAEVAALNALAVQANDLYKSINGAESAGSV